MKKNLIFKIIILTIVFITVYYVFDAIETKDFNIQFAIDKNESTNNEEKVVFQGKLIKFPFNIYYINGILIINDKHYLVNRYKKESGQINLNNNMYHLNLVDRDDQESFYGYAFLVGDITQNSVQSIHITLTRTQNDTGFTHSESIDCYLIK